MKKKKTLAALAAAVVLTALFTPVTAFAWSDGEDDATAGNTQTINGTTSTPKDEGTIAVNGSIGTFDNTVDPKDDDPVPPDTDPRWINVTIPTTVVFASTQADNLNIIGPKYSIVNNSARGVDVSVKSFANVSGDITGMALNLLASDGNNATISGASINLRNGTTNSFITAPQQIATLNKGTASGGKGTPIDTNKGSIKVKMSGAMPTGYTYPASAASPKYTLVLSFAAHA